MRLNIPLFKKGVNRKLSSVYLLLENFNKVKEQDFIKLFDSKYSLIMIKPLYKNIVLYRIRLELLKSCLFNKQQLNHLIMDLNDKTINLWDFITDEEGCYIKVEDEGPRFVKAVCDFLLLFDSLSREENDEQTRYNLKVLNKFVEDLKQIFNFIYKD